MTEQTKRIQLIDGLRGLAVCLMVAHHFLYDLCDFLGAPWWLFSNPVFNILHYIFAGLFVFLSGWSSQYSKSNIKRGIKVCLIAIAFTIITLIGTKYVLPNWFGINADVTIRFGVLHLLGFCMVFFGLTHKLWDSIPKVIAPIIYVVLIVASAIILNAVNPVKIDFLWPIGAYTTSFSSADYFPIFPWLFVFLLGTWFGNITKENKLPSKFYEIKVPFFPSIGRKALIIYIVHQPVLVGITVLIGLCLGIL